MDLREQSLMQGLIVPDHAVHDPFCGCGYKYPESYVDLFKKTESPALFELDLARRPHRWKEVRDLTASFLKSIFKEVTEFEIALLDALGLPEIDKVRLETGGRRQETGGGKEVGIDDDVLRRILEGFFEPLCGRGADISIDNMPIYQYHTLEGFSIGLNKTRGQVEKELPDSVELPPPLNPTLENEYLAKLTADGLKRIKTKIGREYKKRILEILKEGAEQGLNPLRIASQLHREVGEGQMWYWNRLARSEIALALDSAFVAEAKNDGVPYERWSTSANPCAICAAYDGKIWKVGEGPRVVYDTHPHCLCVKYVYIQKPQTIQSSFDHREFSYT